MKPDNERYKYQCHARTLGWLLLVGLWFAGMATPAQALTEATAGQIVERFADAFIARDWDGAARQVHPSALRQFKQSLIPMFEREEARGRTAKMRTALVGYVPSVKVVKEWSDRKFYARFLQNFAVTMRLEEFELIGVVVESERVAFAVVRAAVRGGPSKFVRSVSVETVLDDNNGQGMLINARLLQLVERLIKLNP